MIVFQVVAGAIAMMRCAGCGTIMNQGERSRNPSTPEGRPIHATCKEKLECSTDTDRTAPVEET